LKKNKEFSLIESLSSMLDKGGVTLGVGDDAALFGDTLVAKDIMIEGVHFTKGAPILNIMRKLVTANVSDIAAMGGVAEYALLGIAIPDGFDIDAADIVRPFKTYGVNLIGGDTTSSKDSLFLSVTIIGKKNEHVLTRSGAKAGDVLYVSRPVGRVKQQLEEELAGGDVYNHYLVKAETELGDLLGRTGIATSCIDVSDGLGRDASHISDMSGVKIVVEADRVPVEQIKVENSLEYAISSGEEFALLFTIPADKTLEFEMMSPKSIRIGRVEEGAGVYLETADDMKDISQSGFEHTF
jgi:thiamine-monophosphate kinase